MIRNFRCQSCGRLSEFNPGRCYADRGWSICGGQIRSTDSYPSPAGPVYLRQEDLGGGISRITYAPFHHRVTLTPAQLSALECAGLFESPDSAIEERIARQISFGVLEVCGRQEIEDFAQAITELANGEDAQATATDRDPSQRRGDRGAERALSNLAGRLWGLLGAA